MAAALFAPITPEHSQLAAECYAAPRVAATAPPALRRPASAAQLRRCSASSSTASLASAAGSSRSTLAALAAQEPEAALLLASAEGCVCAAAVLLRSSSWESRNSAVRSLAATLGSDAIANALGEDGVAELLAPLADDLTRLLRERRASYPPSVCSAMVGTCQLAERLAARAGRHFEPTALALVPALVAAAAAPNALVAAAAQAAALALVRHTASADVLLALLAEVKAAPAAEFADMQKLRADALSDALKHWQLPRRRPRASAGGRAALEAPLRGAAADGASAVCV